MSRSSFRAIGTTGRRQIGATPPPSSTTERRYQGRNSGTIGAMRCSCEAAALRLSGRMTPSTKPSVNGNPFASCSTPASRAAAGSGSIAAALDRPPPSKLDGTVCEGCGCHGIRRR